jgi:hypothetical protein
MAPFEVLYGCRCQTSLFWNEMGKHKFLDLTHCKKLRNKFVWWERTWGSCSQDKRVMPTKGEENWFLWLDFLCTSRSHLWKVYDVSWYESSSHLSLLVHWKSQRREKKNSRQSFRVSFLIRPNLRDKIPFKQVGLSHSKIPNFGMWQKFTKS